MQQKLPAFVCVGAAKCGTTSLYHYLDQHPDVFLPKQKELHYHSWQDLRQRPAGPGMRAVLDDVIKTEERYRKEYAEAPEGALAGDFSPSYFNSPNAVESIAAMLGTPKVIILLRHPVKKVFSQYMHLKRSAREPLSFEEALAAEAQREAQGWGDMWLYRSSGFYADHVQRYFDAFGHDNVLVMFSETLRSNPQDSLARIFDFLGLAACEQLDTMTEFNQSGLPRSMLLARLMSSRALLTPAKALIPRAAGARLKRVLQTANTGVKEGISPETAADLMAHFQPDIARLEAMLGTTAHWN